MSRRPVLEIKHPFQQLLFLLGLMAVSVLIFTLLGQLLSMVFWGVGMNDFADLTNVEEYPENIGVVKFMQSVSHLGLFLVPSLFFTYLTTNNTVQFLKLNKNTSSVTWVLIVFVIIFMSPFVNWTIELNSNLKLPHLLSGFEDWIHNTEEKTRILSNSFLKDTSFLSLVSNIIMIGVIPAFGEELLFRGIMQKMFKNWFKNVHWAVIVTSIAFSTFHMQFLGFLPRFLLGMLLGYLFVWTRNLWVPIIVHFINNTAAVIVGFLFYSGKIKTDVESFGSAANGWFIFLSILTTGLLLGLIYLFEYKKREYRR
jgi:membrane protease YdiL (CAAX protease family)